jgi:hypothetical protein
LRPLIAEMPVISRPTMSACTDGLHVGVMAGHVVLQQDPVAAEDVARVGDDGPCLRGVVHLGERRHRRRHATGVRRISISAGSRSSSMA